MPTLSDYQELLARFGTKIPIAEDHESWTYAASAHPTEVVRIYKDSSSERHSALIAKRDLCDILAATEFPFAIEQLYDVILDGNKLYTREKRISGIRLGKILDQDLNPAIELYLGVAEALRSAAVLELAPNFRWNSYISKRITDAFSIHKELLKTNGIVISFAQIMQLNKQIYACFFKLNVLGLVHGNLSLANCMVDPYDKTKITAVLNFSDDTVIGDPRLDVASQLFYTETLDKSIRKKATMLILSYITQIYGEDIYEVINIYRIYKALMLIENTLFKDWSLNVLRNWQNISDAKYIWQPVATLKPIIHQFRTIKISSLIVMDKIEDVSDEEEQKETAEYEAAQGLTEGRKLRLDTW